VKHKWRAVGAATALLVAAFGFGSSVLGAPPTGLTVSVQKDTADSPLYALVSWQGASGATYELQKAYIASAGAQRNWEGVSATPTPGANGRLTLRDTYEIGRGGVCYRARTAGETEYTAEVCSPIPPTSAPGAPNTGTGPADSPEGSVPLALALAAIAATAAVTLAASARRP
jgi:hypothetical protein